MPCDLLFICDLINCEVYDEKVNKLGILIDILQTEVMMFILFVTKIKGNSYTRTKIGGKGSFC